jgi:hypothetical protein
MKRSDFLKSMVGIYGLCSLRPNDIKQYKKVYIKQFFVRGFKYYDGPEIIDQINETGFIELVREKANKYDKNTIALHFNGRKIGFVSQESNKTVSILMDAELLTFHAEVTRIEPEAGDWEKINVAIFVLKEIHEATDLKIIEPFAVLKTPNYHSLGTADDYVVRVDVVEEIGV